MNPKRAADIDPHGLSHPDESTDGGVSRHGASPPPFTTDVVVTPDILRLSRTAVVFEAGAINKLGSMAKSLGATRVFLVTDPGIEKAGHVERARQSLCDVGLAVTVFDGVRENPTTEEVARGVEAAGKADIDFLVGLGGGSSMDCAKGVNFILTNGGEMKDYWGIGKATQPMLPMIAVPTTAGTGSEAQSFALISDPRTHQKMACGDVKAACRAAILDPDLTRTQPPTVAAATALDAVAHAVETAATTKRNDISLSFTSEAWVRINRSFDRAVKQPDDDEARADMLLGAHLAGAAIEHSMLGAAHSCANPLTARFGMVHGIAVGLMLPHIIRFNASGGVNPYDTLYPDAEALAARVESMLDRAALPRRLRELQVPQAALESLAEEASRQWTSRFNPVPVGAVELQTLYRQAY